MKIYFLAVILLFAPKVFAGPSSSGGGGAVRCETSRGGFSFESFDLYSAKVELGLTLLPPSAGLDAELEAAQGRFFKLLQREGTSPSFREAYKKFLNRFHPIPAGSHLAVIPDTNSTLPLPKSCQYVQIIRYIDGAEPDGTGDFVQVDLDYWNQLPAQDKVALFMHEVTYSEYRRYVGARNSSVVRRWVSYFFSTEGLESPDAGLPEDGPLLYCTGSPNTYFQAFPVCDEKGCRTRIQFANIFYMGVIDRVTADVPADVFEQLKSSKLKSQLDLSLRSKSWEGLKLHIQPVKEDSEHHFFTIETSDPNFSHPSALMSCGSVR